MSFRFICDITRDEETAYAFLQQRQCVRRTVPNCNVCGRVMTWIKFRDFHMWRCPSHKEQKVYPRTGSFWEYGNLSFSTSLQLAFFWSSSLTNKLCEENTGLTSKTVTQWYQYFRDTCSHYLVQNPMMISGPNVVVEIDESLIAKRKYNRGHPVPERWVFGGVCPATKAGFLVFVPNREAATLLPLIQRHIHPGSIIHSDGWAAYNGIAAINVQPRYTHLTVNHSVNFVDPATGACTNHVENFWRRAKQKFKVIYGVHDNMIESYLDEFLWRERFEGSALETFNNLLFHISQWYQTP